MSWMRAWGLVVEDEDQVGAPEDLRGEAGILQVQVEVLVGQVLLVGELMRKRKRLMTIGPKLMFLPICLNPSSLERQ